MHIKCGARFNNDPPTIELPHLQSEIDDVVALDERSGLAGGDLTQQVVELDSLDEAELAFTQHEELKRVSDGDF